MLNLSFWTVKIYFYTNSSKSADDHSGVNVWKQHTSCLTDPCYSSSRHWICVSLMTACSKSGMDMSAPFYVAPTPLVVIPKNICRPWLLWPCHRQIKKNILLILTAVTQKLCNMCTLFSFCLTLLFSSFLSEYHSKASDLTSHYDVYLPIVLWMH